MLSDEEKKAIEELWHFDCAYNREINTILNLIEKQSKEIEHQIEKRANQRNELAILNAKQIEFNKLVNIVNSYKGQFKRQQKEIEELNKENTRQHELIGNIHKKWKDKIKAKIEELDYNDIGNFERRCKQEVLQSLLEKE